MGPTCTQKFSALFNNTTFWHSKELEMWLKLRRKTKIVWDSATFYSNVSGIVFAETSDFGFAVKIFQKKKEYDANET